MCRELCGSTYEPANKEQAKWWRKRYYDNHGVWPLTGKQEREGRKPKTPKSKPKTTKFTYAVDKRDRWGGELPEQEMNDSGYGYRMVYPQIKCEHCPAAFHSSTNLSLHIKDRHPEQDGGEGMIGARV